MALANATYLQGFDDDDVFGAERGGGPDGCMAQFYQRKILNKEKSTAAGRKVYDMQDMVRVFVPGDATMTVEQPATEKWRKRFSRQWTAYQEKREQIDGTPLSEWHEIKDDDGLIEKLAADKIRSIESLAGLADQYCYNNPGMIELRKKAIAWVEKQKGMDAALAANQELRDQMAEMAKTMAAMQAQMNAQQAPAPEVARTTPKQR